MTYHVMRKYNNVAQMRQFHGGQHGFETCLIIFRAPLLGLCALQKKGAAHQAQRSLMREFKVTARLIA
jgi:hypothetical protein